MYRHHEERVMLHLLCWQHFVQLSLQSQQPYSSKFIVTIPVRTPDGKGFLKQL